MTAENKRLRDDAARRQNWKRWGPYLAERQWGTVREDYSRGGDVWRHFPHDHARSRAYRWGEDGLLGITDRQCRLCFALALWNGRDPILKERLFGLGGPEGNHGEDVKECYFYLDSTPTHSYMKALYKYPQGEFPYAELVRENGRRGGNDAEFELIDTGIFADGRYFDVVAEYAKGTPNDILARVTISNRGSRAARLEVLPTLWYRNTWSWDGGSATARPRIEALGDGRLAATHPTLGRFLLAFDRHPDGSAPPALFTENETNYERLFQTANAQPHVKDAFHAYVVDGQRQAVNAELSGSKAAPHYRLELAAGEDVVLRLRLSAEDEAPATPFGPEFDEIFGQRLAEADDYHAAVAPPRASAEDLGIHRQAAAGLLWTKQFYHYVVTDWLAGDPDHPRPAAERRHGRNSDWPHLYNRDVISMPDGWEYPWYAAWDLAFHMLPFARLDPDFAKAQLTLFLREWYMHPNGQLPAYEFNLSDVNPPVHAWACWRVYKMTGRGDDRDRPFLARVFHKLLLNFTWWVNRKDPNSDNLFSGGFLGLDNIGIFDRSQPLPHGERLDQADGTAWMAFYCGTMLSMALELAAWQPEYEDVASKFFEHFMAIADAMNCFGGCGLWDEEDGFYYDHLKVDGQAMPLRIRSLVGLIPLLSAEILDSRVVDKLPGFKKRMNWFLDNRPDIAASMTCMAKAGEPGSHHCLLAIPSRERLERVLAYLFDEEEFLSPNGIRSLSRRTLEHPYSVDLAGRVYTVRYTPGESNTSMFGGNSNWRGPVWFPINFLLIEALERYGHFYGDSLTVEYPRGSGRRATLKTVARDLADRLAGLFRRDANGDRPCHGGDPLYRDDPHWRDLVLFYEYFHGDNGRGVGASHQTGWTALVANCLHKTSPRGRF